MSMVSWFQRNSLLVSSVCRFGCVLCIVCFVFYISLLLSQSQSTFWSLVSFRFVSPHIWWFRISNGTKLHKSNNWTSQLHSWSFLFVSSYSSFFLFMDEKFPNANDFWHIFGSWNWEIVWLIHFQNSSNSNLNPMKFSISIEFKISKTEKIKWMHSFVYSFDIYAIK